MPNMPNSSIDIPERYEMAFLESVAKHLNLSPTASAVFKARLCKNNLPKQWNDLRVLSISSDDARKNHWGREVKNALKQWGFDLQENGQKTWLKVREWLEQTKYQSWLWETLIKKSQRTTQQMGFLEVREPVAGSHLGARHAPPEHYVQNVKKGSELQLEMSIPKTAHLTLHLTLLEQEPNGKVVCLCPSEYAKNSVLTAQKHRFPQESAPYPTFAATEVGKERWLALLTPNAPEFKWLESSRHEALELQPVQLQEVLDYVSEEKKEPLKEKLLWYTEYEVEE